MEPIRDREIRGRVEKMTPEKAAELLRRRGMDVTVEQASLILAFLRMLAGMIVSSHLEQIPRMQEGEISDKAA